MEPITFWSAVTWLLATLGGAFAGSYLGAYMKKKGEDRAIKEGFDDLLRQARETTAATKSIEASISDDVWDRQKRWEMKREAIVSAVQSLLEADDALESLARELKFRSEHTVVSGETITERCKRCISVIDAVKGKRVLALIVCGTELDGALHKMDQGLRLAATALGGSNVRRYEELKPALRHRFARVMVFARRELRVESQFPNPQSTVPSEARSSAAPSLGKSVK